MGAGINLFKQLFPEDYYAYQTATLMSSKPTSKVIYDSGNNVIATYPLGGDELRGLLQVVDGQLVAYGDVKPSDGNGTEVFDIDTVNQSDITDTSGYGYTNIVYAVIPKPVTSKDKGNTTTNVICKYPSSNVITGWDSADKVGYIFGGAMYNEYWIGFPYGTSLADMKTALADMPFIYEKATPTAKSYTPFTNPMISGSTEEFTDTRSVKMFCGHDSYYGNDLTYAKANFGQTIYGGSIDFTTGTLISNKNADGTDKTPETISITPVQVTARSGDNKIITDANGTNTVKYYKGA